MDFKINPYYKATELDINSAIKTAKDLVNGYLSNKDNFDKKTKLIGTGNEAKSEVFSILGTDFCLKISKFGKHVGGNQERQFLLNEQCLQAVKDKSITIEGNEYNLSTLQTIAVAEDEQFAYTLMFELKGTIRLWDEEKIPFKDKDNWEVIREIKRILREYAKANKIDDEKFLADMDVNGNNLLVDIKKQIVYLIDPYVPAELEIFEIANTFAYGHIKRKVLQEDLLKFTINPSFEMHILRHYASVSDDYKKELLGKEYFYFDYKSKTFKKSKITFDKIEIALSTKGTKFESNIEGIETPKKLLNWARAEIFNLVGKDELYLIEKGNELKIMIELTYPKYVGEINVLKLKDLSSGQKLSVKRVNRSEGVDSALLINTISDLPTIKTKSIAFLLHGVPELEFYFGTAYPGSVKG